MGKLSFSTGLLGLLAFLTIQNVFLRSEAKILTEHSASASFTLKVLYWSAKYSGILEERVNAIYTMFILCNIGDNYPPPLLQQYLAGIVGMVKLALIAIILMGDRFQVFQMFNIQPPELYLWAKENKMYAIILVFFLSNAIEGQLISTGAFEVHLNDMPVWSKLESGRLPSPEELYQIINQQLKFQR